LVSPLLPYMVVSVLFGVAGNLAAVGLMVFGGTYLINTFGSGTEFTITAAGLLLLSGVLRGPFRFLEQYMGHAVAFRLLAILRNNLYKTLKKLAPAALIDRRSGDIVSSMMGDTEYIEVFFAHTVAPVTIAFIVNTTLLLVVGSFWTGFAFILLPFYLAVGVALPIIWSRLDKTTGKEYREDMGKTNSFVIDSIQGLRELLLFNRMKNQRKMMEEKSKKLNHSFKTLSARRGLLSGTTELLVLGAAAAVMAAGAVRTGQGLLAPHAYLTSVIITLSGFGPLAALSALSSDLVQVFPAAERIFRLMDTPPLVEDPVSHSPPPGSFLEKPRADEAVRLREVSFSYPGSTQPALSQANLTISRGEKVGIIGESGAGKSTIARLFLRFYDPTSGTVCINGMDLKQMHLTEVHSHSTAVLQGTYIFNSSIRQNLLLAHPDASDKEIEEALERAGLDSFLLSLPEGLDTSAGEIGQRFSAGERQRISIARALLHRAEVIIMDEPTSNLDSINERKIIETLKGAFKNKTVIIISHRPSTVYWVDTLYRVKEGCVTLVEDENMREQI
jgi:ATP-binding cassette, subfamily C, bacterial